MPKLKKQPNPSLTIEEFLRNYEPRVLAGALQSLESSMGWEVFKAFLKAKQREYEVAALDLTCYTGKQAEAAKASGIACGLEEAATAYMVEFVNRLNGATGVVESPREED